MVNIFLINDQEIQLNFQLYSHFLLPQKKALRASDDNLAYFEKERVTLEANNLEQKKEAEVILKKLDSYNLIVIRQAGETGQLYGSVNANDIKIALGEKK